MDVRRTGREDLVRQILSQVVAAGHDAQAKFIERLVSLLGIFLVGLQVLIFESLLLLSRLGFKFMVGLFNDRSQLHEVGHHQRLKLTILPLTSSPP